MEFWIFYVGKNHSKTSLGQFENLYIQRLQSFGCQIHLKGLPHQTQGADEEAKKILQLIETTEKKLQNSTLNIVTLEERGNLYKTEDFAKIVKEWKESKSKIAFVLGGSLGHGKAIIQRKHSSISLSPMTFPHQFARVLLLEQIYRSFTIFNNHPYHKD
jgi:rRNA large subunit m3Psi methyltransferase RlmH